MNKSIVTSVRIKPTVLKQAEELKNKYGYSLSDLLEIGILSINKQDTQTETYKKLAEEIANTFTKLSQELEISQKQYQNNLQQIQENQNNKRTTRATNTIINMAKKRKEHLKHKKLEPLGKQYFQKIVNQYETNMETLMNNLEKQGYDEQNLNNIGMYPFQEWNGYKKSNTSQIEYLGG